MNLDEIKNKLNVKGKEEEEDYNIDKLTSLFKVDALDISDIAAQMILGKLQNISSENQKNTVSLMFCDVNGLKSVNDNLGHNIGDAGLKAIGDIIKKNTRSKDNHHEDDHHREAMIDSIHHEKLKDTIAARIGGDEFIIILPNCTKEDALIVKRRIINDIFSRSDELYNMSISIGIADTDEIEIPEQLKNHQDFSYEELNHILKGFYDSLKRKAEERMYYEKALFKQNLSEKDKDFYALEQLKKVADMMKIEITEESDLNYLLSYLYHVGENYIHQKQHKK